MTLRTDKYDDIAKTLGSAGGLDEKQWPGLAIILRSLARDTIEECAAIAETHVHGWEQGEHTAPAAHAVRKLASSEIAESIRSLHHSHPGLEREKE